jgi:sterol desaturase/sphingolipid hydroxylase (fatty acid hydroxylase superfamily)
LCSEPASDPTQQLHRAHYSVLARETNSNIGFNLPWWNRLFGTCQNQPERGHEGMTINVETFCDPAKRLLDRMLTQLFRTWDDDHPLGRREATE